MKASKILLAIMLILTAITIVLYGIELNVGGGETPWAIIGGEYVSLWQMLGGIVCLYWLLYTLIAKKTFRKKIKIFMPLAVAFIIFEKNIAIALRIDDGNVINNWLVLVAAILLSVAVDILIPRKHKAFRLNSNYCSNSLGSHYYTLDSTKASHTLKNNLGELTAHFQNVEFACETIHLEVSNNLGEMNINVPPSWTVVCNVNKLLGSVNVRPDPAVKGTTTLIVNGENNLGQISIN